MPDRCTPEYERLVAKMGSLLPYRRARTLLAEFLPLADVPAVETTRRRTMRVGAIGKVGDVSADAADDRGEVDRAVDRRRPCAVGAQLPGALV